MGIAASSSRKARAYWELAVKIANDQADSDQHCGIINPALKAIEPLEWKVMLEAEAIAKAEGPTAR